MTEGWFQLVLCLHILNRTVCGPQEGVYINTASVVSSVSVSHISLRTEITLHCLLQPGPGRGHWYTGDTHSGPILYTAIAGELVWFLILPTVSNTTFLQSSFLVYFPAVAIVKVLHAAWNRSSHWLRYPQLIFILSTDECLALRRCSD